MLTAREARVRRVCKRRGYILKKKKRNDRRALDAGNYHLLDAFKDGKILFPTAGPEARWGTSLDAVEAWLEKQPRRAMPVR